MKYDKDSFFDDMITCFHRFDNYKLSKNERINALLDAYDIIHDMQSQWGTISSKHRSMAVYYMKVYINPTAEKYGIILDGDEPKYKEERIVTLKRKKF